MRTILTTIVIVASISSVAFAELIITVPDILVSDTDASGSFEVFVNTDGETPAISGYQTRLLLIPSFSGISIEPTGAVVETVVKTPLVPDSEISYTIGTVDHDNNINTPEVRTIDVVGLPTAVPNLFDEAGLFKVNFDITPGTPPYPIFDVIMDPAFTILADGVGQPLTHTVDNGDIQIQSTGPHELRIDLDGGAGGNWANETSTLLLTYGKAGATGGRVDPGVNGDVAIGWGNDKFNATNEGDYGVYSRGAPFGSGDDMLVQDARPLDDTSANVLIETYTNKVFDAPTGEWVPGVTWNEGGTLEFTVESSDKAYFDNFQILQKEPGRFLDHPDHVTPILLGDFLDANGHGSLPFDRVGCQWLSGEEIDWWIGPFASFDLIPPDGTAWPGLEAPLAVEMGSYLIGHPPTPEPSSFMLLAIAGFGACTRRRRLRNGQG